MKISLASIFVCLAVAAEPAWSATYYVRKDGSDAACDGLTDAAASAGSRACAFVTVQKALTEAASPGDSVRIHGGTYFEVLNARNSGAPGNPITIEAAPGETVTVDSGPEMFRTPGNTDWELIDPALGEYRSVLPVVPSNSLNPIYAYIAGVSNYENERVALNPYQDTRGKGGLSGFSMFRAETDAYVDPATPFYVGPGTWREKLCSGGSAPGALCEVDGDCPGLGTCAATHKIRIRLSKTADLRAAEARYGRVLDEENDDPRRYSIVLSQATHTLKVYGAYLVFTGLVFNQAGSTISLEGTSHDITFDGVTVWIGDKGILADDGANPPYHIKVVNSRIYGDSPHWIFWSDQKNAPFPSDLGRGTSLDMRKGTHDWEIHHNHIRGGHDGLSTNDNETRISLHHNRIENFKDDAFEVEGLTDIGTVWVYENYIGNCLTALAPGQDSPTVTGPIYFYRNVVALLRDTPVNRTAGINAWNGGYRFGNEYVFKQHSPNTFYYHNTVVLLNSHTSGINLVPGDPGEQNDTYVFNNIYVKVNGRVQGTYLTGLGQIVDHNLYWKMNTDDTEPLAGGHDTVPGLSAAIGLEIGGLGETPKRGTDPKFSTWGLTFDRSEPTRWKIGADGEVWSSADFLLAPTSPAIGAGMLLPFHPTFGPMPDSRPSQADVGALPSDASPSEWDTFPFNQGWKGPSNAPDLAEISVSNPPARASIATDFGVSDTAKNQGSALAGASTTGYYLSADTFKDPTDRRLSGSRAVSGLASGDTSGGSATVGVPADMPEGSYYLLACADDLTTVAESDETDNCRASSSQVQVGAPDLAETSLSDPPATSKPGSGFSVTDNAEDRGSGDAGASSTRFYLSADTAWDALDRRMAGSRDVPGLASGAASSGTTSVTVPADTAEGDYYVLACADDLVAVTERNETNNCLSSTGRVRVALPDVVETSVSNPPSKAAAGSSFSVTDTAKDQGTVDSDASTTRFYLSTDTAWDALDRRMAGSRDVPALASGASSGGTTTVTVPVDTAEGTYYVIACADDLAGVRESDETNNCRASSSQVQATVPDLMETSVGNPPSSVKPGSSFTASDTVKNQGSASSSSSTTRYYLSADGVRDPSDRLLSGSRSVSGLSSGSSSSGSATVTVPSDMHEGLYYLLACADDLGAVIERDEANNCRASSGQVRVTVPDLVETSVGNPPSSVKPGSSFTASDTVKNQGSASASSSTARYYLSADGAKDGADTLLSGERSVSSISSGSSSSGSKTVTVPSGTAEGSYYLLACADDKGVIAEIDETNNCLASVTQVRVIVPDLVETSVSDPPSTAVLGGTFTASDTVKNQGSASASSSTTRYYLSADGAKDGTDKLLSGERSVSSISSGSSSSGSKTVTVPSGTAEGSYYLLACADDKGVIPENDESNNCLASAGRVQVTAPDLVETSVSDPPASAVAGGSSFSVTDTVKNQGTGSSKSTTTRYYLSSDTTKDGADKQMSGSRSVSSLSAGASSSGTASVSVSSSTAEGLYYLLACADDSASVPESDESNNCRASAGRVQVTLPDLVETAVSDPPASAGVSSSFSVTDTVRNQGSGSSKSSTTRYYLSSNTTKDGADKQMSGSRSVSSLAVGASSTGTATVTVPSSTAEGLYYVLACADDSASVTEQSEANNCLASAGRVQINLPDLVETAVSDPPASAVAGGSFPVTDTASNSGGASAGSSTTRYYLSSDTAKDSADKQLSGSRSVSSLAAGASSTGTVTVTVSSSMAEGLYYILACADDSGSVTEHSESNNCLASAGKVLVGP